MTQSKSRMRIVSAAAPSPLLPPNPEPVLIELEVPAGLKTMAEKGEVEKDIRRFSYGYCQILVGRSKYGWHLSISHPYRLPEWDECKFARYNLVPDEANMALLMPPKAEYINVHGFCLHLWEVPKEIGKIGR